MMAANFPRTRDDVGIERVAPEAAVRPSPAAVVKEAAVMGSNKKTGCAVDVRMHKARVKAIKPCKIVFRLILKPFNIYLNLLLILAKRSKLSLLVYGLLSLSE